MPKFVSELRFEPVQGSVSHREVQTWTKPWAEISGQPLNFHEFYLNFRLNIVQDMISSVVVNLG